MSPSSPSRRNLLIGLALGLVALAAGVALAGTFLPEWRAGRPLAPAAYRDRYLALMARAGLSVDAGTPRVNLVTRGPEQFEPYRSRGDEGSRWLMATRTAVRVAVSHRVRDAGGGLTELSVDFGLDGRPQSVLWWQRAQTSPFQAVDPVAAARIGKILTGMLLAPDERLGPMRQDTIGTFPRLLFPLEGGRRPQHLVALITQGAQAERRPGPLSEASAAEADAYLVRIILHFWGAVPWFLGLALLFLILLVRSRLSLVNGALLAAAALATLYPTPGYVVGPRIYVMAMMALTTLQTFLLWSCGESLLRSSNPGFTTSLDALRAGRLGPRGGRALLVGFGFGAGLAGLRLLLLSLAEALPRAWPGRSSLDLPILRPLGSPLADGILLAGAVALALALAVRILPLRWAPAAATLAAGLFLHPVPLRPWLPGALASVLFAGLLVWIGRRHGLTALLTAAVCSLCLPAAIFAEWYLAWMPAGFALTAGLPAAALLFGILGLRRSGAAEVARLEPPAFVRRLEGERRFKHEMELLAKMQRGLLPRTLPRLPGYELAARSIIANEAGGDLYDVLSDDEGYVWIAAGDVAGHGYSCAIAQAMTKSALASLIGRGRTPAEVLRRADLVLRAAGPARSFTSLALLRLRPETGEGLLSNAGHPYPLLAENGRLREIEMPALPLGKGPPRTYEDREIRIVPGGYLLLYSDGLFEATDGDGEAYGFERLRDALRGAEARSAEKILDGLIEDWRRHLRSARPIDDTTVVAVKRDFPGERS
ncbi:MAG: PP2C family protein-serine/threonine phosphatase [Thermoanaerobaculia bacterium]